METQGGKGRVMAGGGVQPGGRREEGGFEWPLQVQTKREPEAGEKVVKGNLQGVQGRVNKVPHGAGGGENSWEDK